MGDQDRQGREIIEYLLPFVQSAGRYALEIQERVESKTNKELSGNFAQALTDGDISIQTFIEVALLAKFPEIAFYGEEHEHSLNMKYFPQESCYEVIADPIDGTLLFKDGLPIFSLIVSVLKDKQFEASLCLIPGKEIAYVGLKGEGAFCVALGAGDLAFSAWQRHQIPGKSNVIQIYDNPLLSRALSREFEVVDPARDYPAPNWKLSTYSVLAGDSGALVSQRAQAIDGAAIGFIIGEAGGHVCGFNGAELEAVDADYMCGGMVAARDREFAERIRRCLEGVTLD